MAICKAISVKLTMSVSLFPLPFVVSYDFEAAEDGR